MLRNVIVAPAIVLVLGSSAFARGGGYSGGGGGDGFRASHFGGGFGGSPGDGVTVTAPAVRMADFVSPRAAMCGATGVPTMAP
jgi:hypothetical protein